MSETAAPIAPPSNGSASTATAPALGVTAPTAPKDGEGAVTDTKPAWQNVRTKMRWSDGQEEEIELDEATLQRRLIAAKAADKYSKEARALAQEKAAREEAKRRGDILDDQASKDAYFQKRLEEEARRAQLSEGDRQLDDARREAAQAKQLAQTVQRQLQQRLEQDMEQRAWGELEPRVRAGMEKFGMVGDTFSHEEIAHVAKEFLDAGIDAPPETVIAEAAAREKERFAGRIQKVPAQALWKQLTPDQRKELLAIGVTEWKASRGQPVPQAQPAQQEQRPREEHGRYISEREFLRGLRNGK